MNWLSAPEFDQLSKWMALNFDILIGNTLVPSFMQVIQAFSCLLTLCFKFKPTHTLDEELGQTLSSEEKHKFRAESLNKKNGATGQSNNDFTRVLSCFTLV